jgi:signal transduction histidine kinase
VSPLLGFVLAGASVEAVTRVAPGFDNDSFALVMTFFVALWSLGRHTSGTERWIGAVGVLAVIVNFMFDESAGGLDPGDVAFSVVFVGAPWLAGLTMRVRHDRDVTWRERNEQLRAEQEERERRAVTAERSRIARELHDVVSHAIAVTVLQARGARRQLGTDEAAVRRALDAIDHTNTQALSDMRRLLALLRDTEDSPLGDPQPTLDRLPDLVEDVRGSGLPVALHVSGSPSDVPPGVELSAYRIVQEALTNVLKHAGSGATATVDLAYGDGALELCVRDDGRGADGDGRPGHGLVGIRERVAVVGGQVTTGPRAEGGFAVSVRLPYAVEV